jgi:hypothetical protein
MRASVSCRALVRPALAGKVEKSKDLQRERATCAGPTAIGRKRNLVAGNSGKCPSPPKCIAFFNDFKNFNYDDELVAGVGLNHSTPSSNTLDFD